MSNTRPFGIGLISFLIGLNGLVAIVVGGLLLAHKGEDFIIDALDVSSGNVQAFAIASLVIGGIGLIIALALRGGSNIARMLLVVMWLSQIGILVWSMVELHSVHWSNALWPAVISGLAVAYLLFDQDARRFFKGSAS